MNRKLFLVALIVLVPTMAWAQEPWYEKILIPIAIQSVGRSTLPGAFGSVWTTRLSVFNGNDQEVQINGYDQGCQFGNCPSNPTPAGITLHPRVSNYSDVVPGYFLIVDRVGADKIAVHLRVLELSRAAQPFGTSLPVVRENDWRTDAIELLAVPTSTENRVLLRIYDYHQSPDARARVRIFAPGAPPTQPDRLLFDTELSFTTFEGGISDEFPAYAQLNTAPLTELAGTEIVRIEVTPATPGLRFWAFASVTHNATQAITIIEPR